MRASIIIAAHNEGDNLRRTVRSCLETTEGLDFEIVVADDASTDGSVSRVRRLYPQVRRVGYRRRQGCSAAKDLGARRAKGRVLVFLDGHCKPERHAIHRLVAGVEELDGQGILTPRVPALDVRAWKNMMFYVGQCYSLDLRTLAGRWIPPEAMRRKGRFYESPAFVGCCLALSRRLYLRLRGFDRHMVEWGVEDIDLSLKAWLLGYPVLHDPAPIIGHRFRKRFDNFRVAMESFLSNQIRMARKHFSEPVWEEWLRAFQSRQKATLWNKAWSLYQKGLRTADGERRYLLRHRIRDEYWYASRFGLAWPKRNGAGGRRAGRKAGRNG